MNKKIVSMALLWLLLVTGFGAIVSVYAQYEPVDVRDLYHFKYEGIGDPGTVDPAWAIDTASRALIFNLYDTLVFFNHTKFWKFLPSLASEWLTEQPPHPDAPEGTNQTWYFTIRENVKFQDGSTLTTEDVEYSFERAMVQDRSGGPVWMFNEPLIGSGWPDKSGWPEAPGNPIDTAVESNTTHVWFNLAMPYPRIRFMQILCGSWASILSKAWCSAIPNEWDGDWSDWKSHEDPDNSPLDVAGDLMMGTGPYMLDYWDHGVAYSIVAFNKDDTWPTGYDPAGPSGPHTYEYWQGWPAENASNYLKRFTSKVNYAWGVRLTNFIAGIADDVYVPHANLLQMITNWPTKWVPNPGPPPPYDWNPEEYPKYYMYTRNATQHFHSIRCLPGIPTLTIDAAMFFTFDTHPASPYVGTGSFPNGIPLDFFSDKRIRQAFAYSFNYTRFLARAFWGEASQPTSPVIEGLPYHNPDNPRYSLDLTKAKELFMAASADPSSLAYQVWDLGFTMSITFGSGNWEQEEAAIILKTNIENLFKNGPDGVPGTGDEAPGNASITRVGVPSHTFEGELVSGIMPLFITDWLNEYTDPNDAVCEFMYTYGHFSRFQGYSNATVDALIEQGITIPDTNWPARQAIYDMLQLMYFQDVPSVCLAQPLKRHWEQWWVQGWYHNPLYPGQKYFYHLWKGLDGDINGDGKLDILDLGEGSGHWWPGPPVGAEGYCVIADVFPKNMKVISDPYPYPYDAIPKVWDSENEIWIPHPSIGEVDVYDAALVSAHWLEEINPV